MISRLGCSRSHHSRPSARAILSALVAIALLSISILAEAYTLPGQVREVPSGDALVVIGPGQARYAVSLSDMDAPELNQRFGAEARDRLRRRLLGRFVVVEWRHKGADGSLSGRVWLNRTDMNLEQLHTGMAWYRPDADVEPGFAAGKRPPHPYALAQQAAREAARGLWSDRQPVAPWRWRGGLRLPSQRR